MCRAIQPIVIAVISLIFIAACQPSGQQPLQRWQHAVEGAYAASISDDSSLAAVSSVHHGISLWDLNKNTQLFNWSQQQDSADNLVLAIDIAAGEGETLEALAEIALVSDKTAFFTTLQNNFDTIYPSDDVSYNHVSTAIRAML